MCEWGVCGTDSRQNTNTSARVEVSPPAVLSCSSKPGHTRFRKRTRVPDESTCTFHTPAQDHPVDMRHAPVDSALHGEPNTARGGRPAIAHVPRGSSSSKGSRKLVVVTAPCFRVSASVRALVRARSSR